MLAVEAARAGMTGLIPRLRRTSEPEWLDVPGHEPTVLAGNLADLRRVNRWFGGIPLTLRGLDRLTGSLRTGDSLAIVDVATGSADIPQAVAVWARRRGWRPRILATDLSMEVLGLAGRDAEVLGLAAADGRRLPLADRSVEVAMCSLVLHHLEPDGAVAMLAEMGRVSRLGVVVNDLVRGWWGYLTAWAFSRALTRNPLTRHDGPLSARRAYTPAEMAALATRAGLGGIVFDGWLGYRVAMTAQGPG